MARDNFFDGYIDGWQSVRPESIPSLSSAKAKNGASSYRDGFVQGKAAALETGTANNEN